MKISIGVSVLFRNAQGIVRPATVVEMQEREGGLDVALLHVLEPKSTPVGSYYIESLATSAEGSEVGFFSYSEAPKNSTQPVETGFAATEPAASESENLTQEEQGA
jgi:hypothetical protein